MSGAESEPGLSQVELDHTEHSVKSATHPWHYTTWSKNALDTEQLRKNLLRLQGEEDNQLTETFPCSLDSCDKLVCV